MRAAGAELVPFSPLRDRDLPRDAGALWIFGGHPADYTAELEANRSLRVAVGAAVESGMPTYAECGGLMFFAQTLRTAAGSRAMVGAVAGATSMTEPRLQMRYRRATAANASPLDPHGMSVRAYEFHFATSLLVPVPPAYAVGSATDGVVRERCIAAILHRHFLPGDPAIDRFVAAAAAFT